MHPQATGSDYRVDDLVVDTGRARVTRCGNEVPLPKLSFDLLLALIENAPRIASPDVLMQRVWPGLVVSPETLSQRVKLLRDALGDDPKQPRYIAAVRGRGYRLIVPVTQLDAPAVNAAAPQPAGPTPDTRRIPWRWLALGAGAAVLLVGVVLALIQSERTDSAIAESSVAGSSAPLRSVAVMAFENLSPAADGEVLALGISEAVLHQLADLHELTVISRTSSFAFRGKSEDARAIARKLNVRYLLEGSVQSDRERLRVTAQLIDAATGGHVWSMRFDRTPRDIFAVQDEIAVEVTRALKLSLDASLAAKLTGQGTKDFDAYLAFLQARALLANWRVADMKAAIEQLSIAIRVDPTFAPAYVQLASAQVLLAEFEVTDDRRARFEAAVNSGTELIEKALALDATNGEAYVERGYLRAFSDLEGAEADYRRGLELSPNYAKGYEGLASILFEDPARRSEAMSMLDRARLLDPLEPRYDVSKALFHHYGRGEAQEAREILVGVLKRDPLYGPALMRLGEVLWNLGEFAEGVKSSEQALELDPLSEWPRHIVVASYLDLGEPAAAERVIEEAPHPLAARAIQLQLYRHDWRRAGETAYVAAANETVSPIEEALAVAAIRMHARATGDYARARDVLQAMSGVSWKENGDPRLAEGATMKDVVVGLADVLQASGERERASRLLRASLARMDYEARQLGRGEFWYWHSRAMALAMLGESDAAIDTLQHAVAIENGLYRWWYFFEIEPAYAGLRTDKRFIALLETVRRHAAVQRQRLAQLRADELVPERQASESAAR